jgi:hypothetical protein
MNTIQTGLEKRVRVLEEEVAALKVRAQIGDDGKDWRRTIGMFTGNEEMKAIDEWCLAEREKERERARKNGRKRTRSKK